MCGITGFFSKSIAIDQWTQILTSMATVMAHRGPDDQDIWYDVTAGMGLAHRRLSIIDLSTDGRQPMISTSGRYVIVYNGEVYNFKQIRKYLEGVRINWRGGSDTEVILAAIETWGIKEAVKQFIGMFAFAVWDRKERRLSLCRDRLGIKPLYYGKCKDGFLFGSELKPFSVFPDFKPAIDRNALALYFRFNCIPAPFCIFQNTRKLLPGTILTLSAEHMLNRSELPEPEPYWSAAEVVNAGQKQAITSSPDQAIEELHALLKDAVGLRMISDVPLGAFLSGGIDSSMVVALMQTQSTDKIKTFSIGFSEEGYNEAIYAKNVAEHLGTAHTELYVTAAETLKVIEELPFLYDEPFADSSQIPTVLLSRLTRRHVTVSLSGDGGDELFGGYNRYFWGRIIWNTIGMLPVGIRKVMAAGLQNISPLSWDSLFHSIIRRLPDRFKLDTPGDRIHKLADVIASNGPEDMYQLLISHWNKPEKLVINSMEPSSNLIQHPWLTRHKDFTHQMMYFDLINYLPNDILTKVDRASMGVGLEARVPLLDHRIVEFAWRLPLSMKIKGGQGKWIFRKVLELYVPRQLFNRPKTGFAIPIDTWLRTDLRAWAEELLSEKKLAQEGFLNSQDIRQKWLEHVTGKRNWQYHLWDVLMFQAWKAHYRV